MASHFRTFILRWPSSTPTATFPGPRATAGGEANEAAAYSSEKLADAEARATAIVNLAQADHARSLALALSQSRRILLSAVSRPNQAPVLTDFRLFWEAIAGVMADKPKLILDGSSVGPSGFFFPRLPLEQAAPWRARRRHLPR